MEKKGLIKDLLTAEFFSEVLNNEACSSLEKLKVVSIEPHPVETGYANTVGLSDGSPGLIGHFRYDIKWQNSGEERITRLVIKSKPHGKYLINNIRKYYQKAGGDRLVETLDLATPNVQVKTHIRECAIYDDIRDPRFKKLTPKVFKTWCDEKQEIAVIVLEFFENVTHLDARKPKDFNQNQIEVVLRDIAEYHSIYLKKTDIIEKKPWCDSFKAMDLGAYVAHWECVLEYLSLSHHVANFCTPNRIKVLRKLLGQYPSYWDSMKQYPVTLIHNNFHPGNFYLKQSSAGLQTGIFDWDTAWIHVPQRDVCEFLSWVLLPEQVEYIPMFVDFYRKNLENFSGLKFSKKEFDEIYVYANVDYFFGKLFVSSVLHENYKKYTSLAPRYEFQFPYMQAVFGKNFGDD